MFSVLWPRGFGDLRKFVPLSRRQQTRSAIISQRKRAEEPQGWIFPMFCLKQASLPNLWRGQFLAELQEWPLQPLWVGVQVEDGKRRLALLCYQRLQSFEHQGSGSRGGGPFCWLHIYIPCKGGAL